MNEADFQTLITDLATLCGWRWVHFRPARTKRGWRTPVEGPLGEGWPDLILLRDERIIAVELKGEGGRSTDAQREVLRLLAGAGIPTYVWRPSDFPVAEVVLRRRAPEVVIR